MNTSTLHALFGGTKVTVVMRDGERFNGTISVHVDAADIIAIQTQSLGLVVLPVDFIASVRSLLS